MPTNMSEHLTKPLTGSAAAPADAHASMLANSVSHCPSSSDSLNHIGGQVLFESGDSIAKAVLDRLTAPTDDSGSSIVLQILTAWPPSAPSSSTIADNSAPVRARFSFFDGTRMKDISQSVAMAINRHDSSLLPISATQRHRLLVVDDQTRRIYAQLKHGLRYLDDPALVIHKAIALRYAVQNGHVRADKPVELVSLSQTPIFREHIYEQLGYGDRASVHIYGPGIPDFSQIPGEFSRNITSVRLYMPPLDIVDYSSILTDLPSLRRLILGPLEVNFEPWQSVAGQFDPDNFMCGLMAGAQDAHDLLLATIAPFMNVSNFCYSYNPPTVLRQITLKGAGLTMEALVLIVGISARQSAEHNPSPFIVGAFYYGAYEATADDDNIFSRRVGRRKKYEPIIYPEPYMMALLEQYLRVRNQGESCLASMLWHTGKSNIKYHPSLRIDDQDSGFVLPTGIHRRYAQGPFVEPSPWSGPLLPSHSWEMYDVFTDPDHPAQAPDLSHLIHEIHEHCPALDNFRQ